MPLLQFYRGLGSFPFASHCLQDGTGPLCHGHVAGEVSVSSLRTLKRVYPSVSGLVCNAFALWLGAAFGLL